MRLPSDPISQVSSWAPASRPARFLVLIPPPHTHTHTPSTLIWGPNSHSPHQPVTLPALWGDDPTGLDRAPQFRQRILLFLRCHLTVPHGSGQSRVMPKPYLSVCFEAGMCNSRIHPVHAALIYPQRSTPLHPGMTPYSCPSHSYSRNPRTLSLFHVPNGFAYGPLVASQNVSIKVCDWPT